MEALRLENLARNYRRAHPVPPHVLHSVSWYTGDGFSFCIPIPGNRVGYVTSKIQRRRANDIVSHPFFKSRIDIHRRQNVVLQGKNKASRDLLSKSGINSRADISHSVTVVGAMPIRQPGGGKIHNLEIGLRVIASGQPFAHCFLKGGVLRSRQNPQTDFRVRESLLFQKTRRHRPCPGTPRKRQTQGRSR